MVDHPDQHAVVRRDLDRIADHAAFDQRLGERGAQHRRIRSDARALSTCERAELLHLQVRAAGGRRQRRRALQHFVDQLAAQFVVGALAGAFSQHALQFRTCLLERHFAAGLDLAHVDDVPAEVALDRPGNRAGRGREHGVLESFDHLSVLEDPAQIAPGVLRTAVFGVLTRERGEIRAGRLRLRRQRTHLGLGRFLRSRIGAGFDLHQDVRSEALFGFDETRLVLFVLDPKRVLVGGRRRRHRRSVDIDIFDRHHLRRTEVVRMRLVPTRDLCRRHRRGIDRYRQHRV